MRPLLAALLLAPGAAWAAPKNPGTLVYATYWDVDSMDPAWAESMSPLFNVYETLVDYEGPGAGAGDLVGRLARAVPSRENGLISADGLTYRFPIRKGVIFHDGSPLTPEDVRYSLLRFMLLDRAGGPPVSALLEPVTGLSSTRRDGVPLDEAYERAAAAVRVEGDAVVVKLARPFSPLLAVLANFGRVVSKDWCAARGQWDGRRETWKRHNDAKREDVLPNGAANGTGPFKLERWDPVGRQLILSRHAGYWRAPARLERVVFKTVPEFAARKLMLQAGDADVIAALPMQRAQLEGLPGVEVSTGLRKLQSATSMAFNLRVSPERNPDLGSGKLDGEGVPPGFFADKDAREGFARAVDYDAYVRDVLKGAGSRAGALIPPGMPGHTGRPPRRGFDLKAAEAHLRRAWGGELWKKGFKFTLTHLAGRDDVDVAARMLKRHLESLNPRFRLDIRTVPLASYSDLRAARKLALLFTGWTADYADPHDFAVALMHSAGRFPAALGHVYPGADALIQEASATLDEARRAELYARLEALQDEELFAAPLAANTHLRVQRSWVKGFVFNPALHGLPYDSVYYQLWKE